MRTVAFAAALLATTVYAAPMPYDETADARAELRQALVTAKETERPVLVIFGANWCEDCRALDKALNTGRNAELVKREFGVVKVDVGNFNKNMDLAQALGNPVKKGIPAAVILSPQNEVLYATHAGELADARHMSESGIYDFFRTVTEKARKKP